MRLAGKVAIVTGAARGIGRGIAERMAADGARVVIADVNQEGAEVAAAAIRSLGGAAMAVGVDLTQISSIAGMIGKVLAQEQRIDILVNNAGVMQTKPMLELTEADWDRVVDTNMKGLFFCLQAVARQMVSQKLGGRIVNMSSVAGRSGRPLATHYAAAKAAVINITRSAAFALAEHGICVNAVCPGYVPTPMWDEIEAQRIQLFGHEPGTFAREVVGKIPLGRPGTPDELARAVVFLCSDDAAYVTGQTLNVCGGMEMD